MCVLVAYFCFERRVALFRGASRGDASVRDSLASSRANLGRSQQVSSTYLDRFGLGAHL